MNNISNALHLLLAIFAIWYLVVCWSEYRLDILRQRLFAVRDELFLTAAKGEIDFSENAYLRLRMLMNGMIRYAHRLRIPQVLVSRLIVKSVAPESFLELWGKDIAELPAGKRIHLQDAYENMQSILTKHLRTSFFGILLSCLFAPLSILFAITRVSHKKTMNRQEMLLRSIRPLEDETFMLEKTVKNSEFKLAHS